MSGDWFDFRSLHPSSLHAGGYRVTHTLPGAAFSWKKDMDEVTEERLERRRRRRQRLVSVCKSLAAFSFSHIGLAAMVVAYSIAGGFLFRALEAPAEQREKLKIIAFRQRKMDDIWELHTSRLGHGEAALRGGAGDHDDEKEALGEDNAGAGRKKGVGGHETFL